MSEEGLSETQRWTAKRRAALIVSVLRGETSAAEAARSHGHTLAEVEDWKEKFLLAGDSTITARVEQELVRKKERVKKLKKNVGDFVPDIDKIGEAVNGHPIAERTSDSVFGWRGG